MTQTVCYKDPHRPNTGAVGIQIDSELFALTVDAGKLNLLHSIRGTVIKDTSSLLSADFIPMACSRADLESMVHTLETNFTVSRLADGLHDRHGSLYIRAKFLTGCTLLASEGAAIVEFSIN